MDADLDDLVRLTVAAIADAKNDGDVYDALLASGVEAELADRLTTVVPIAFGRSFLERRGAKLEPYYVVHRRGVPDEERPLVGEPVYERALHLARNESFEAYARCVEWSAEVGVALSLPKTEPATQRFEGASFSPPVQAKHGDPRTLWERLRGAVPKTPEVAIPSDFYGATELLRLTLVEHGLKVEAKRDGFQVGDVHWSAFVYPHQVSAKHANLQLDVRVRSPRLGERRIVESTGGFEATARDAVKDAFHKFLRGSLHPLLHVFHPGACADEDDDDRKEMGHGSFRAAMGNATFTFYERRQDLDFGPLIDEMEDALFAEPLQKEIHWVRLWAFRAPQLTVNEALLDNEPCPRLEAALAKWPLEPEPKGASVRLFLVMVPSGDRDA